MTINYLRNVIILFIIKNIKDILTFKKSPECDCMNREQNSVVGSFEM